MLIDDLGLSGMCITLLVGVLCIRTKEIIFSEYVEAFGENGEFHLVMEVWIMLREHAIGLKDENEEK